MLVSDFDFVLPDERIALRPAEPRDNARMMVVAQDDTRSGFHIRDLPQFLAPGDVCVINDTRVIPARLFGTRLARGVGDGAQIEVTLHKRTGENRFLAFARPAKRLKRGDNLLLGKDIEAEVASRGQGGEVELTFALVAEQLDAAIRAQGEMPLPPYIARRRPADLRDHTDYQTIFARDGCSVAAPTAGLHFTPELIATLKEKSVFIQTVTLEVGAGTFLPVTVDDTANHRMHAEHALLTAQTADVLNSVRDAGGKILAVGTTALRTLESAVDNSGRFHAFDADTAIFITPGYRIRGADILLTNFHLPRSTLFMLVCAFMGTDVMKAVYATAIREAFRFYSYGDACLLFRPPV